MTVSYVCRKCGKEYSNQDFEESRFCRECGSFLIARYDAERWKAFSRSILRQGQHFAESTSANPRSSPVEAIALARAAQSLRQRTAGAREYEVVSETKERSIEAGIGGFGSWVLDSEYNNALNLEKELIRKFKGKNLQDAIPGQLLTNEQGECYSISTNCVAKFGTPSYEKSRQLLISDLKIIPGIGPAREKALKQQGYSTVEKLTEHPIWGKTAHKYMRQIEAKEIAATQNWLWQRLPKSHPLAHYLAGLGNSEDFAIIDIETLGLSERPIILMGIAKPSGKSICTSQFLLRDIPDEPSAIWALISELDPKSSLITFNGKSFDIPYIKQRLAYYGMDAPFKNPHFDVLHFTRRALGKRLSDCRLETVEKYLHIEREINIPGALVPHFYDTYLKTKNVGPLIAIVEHNKQDLITLGNLFSRLYEEWNL